MKLPKNQHWIPRFYLREFATPDSRSTNQPQVWAFPREQGEPFLTNVRGIAAKRYLYAPRRRDDSRDPTMEARLSGLESTLAAIWPQLATGWIDIGREQPARKAVALFVATLILRHPQVEDHVASIHEQLVAFYDTLPKDARGNPQVSSIEYQGTVHAFDSADYHDYKNAGHDDLHRMFVDNISQQSGWLATTLLNKRWSIVAADEEGFIATDSPVVIAHSTRGSFGVGTRGVVISLPLSPKRVLILDDRQGVPDGQYYSLGPHGHAPFNVHAWTNCRGFMISSRHTDIVCSEMLRWTEAQGT